MKKFDIKADAWAVGEPPAEVFVLDGKVSIAEKDGGKAIQIDPGTELVEASAQFGDSASGSASIQARVFASKKGRSTPRFGLSVHGMSGYRLYVNPAKKLLELVKADQVVATAPITASAWPATEAAAPATPQLKHEDKGLKGQGKCAIWATPYSNTPIYFDDIQIEIEAAPAK